MAIVTRPGSQKPSVKLKFGNEHGRNSSISNVMKLKSCWTTTKIQLCTLALTSSLFNVIRLPRDAFIYGPIPYLLAYTAFSLIVALPIVLLELAVGQLTQQDGVGVWRAVPILRGVGHIKLLTSYVCCIYYVVPFALSFALIVWIGKGTFPLRECAKLQMTPVGYENKMNATDCFNTTFLAQYPNSSQYIGIMAIIVFMLWFFTPIVNYRLSKSIKTPLGICALICLSLALIFGFSLGEGRGLALMQPGSSVWSEMLTPKLWLTALVQSLLSTQIKSGFLISCGGSIYYKSNVKWTALTITFENTLAAWFWVILWSATGGEGVKDTSFLGILVQIYQAAVTERRAKQWPVLAYCIVFFSGIITMVTLLYPICDRLHRLSSDRWRLFSYLVCAVGTALSIILVTRGLHIVMLLEELAVPFLVVFTTVLECIAFVFIYGWDSLIADIEFLIHGKLQYIWVVPWWTSPFIIIGITGWWLRSVLQASWNQPHVSLWPLLGIFVAALSIITVFAAIAVAKEEQYNLFSKMISAFRPSRLWGPDDPMVRYQWMSQRQTEYQLSEPEDLVSDIFPPLSTKEKAIKEDWVEDNFVFQRPYYSNPAFEDDYAMPYTHQCPVQKHIKNILNEYKLSANKSPDMIIKGNNSKKNIATLSEKVIHEQNCKCGRHFSLRVPHYVNGEITTNL